MKQSQAFLLFTLFLSTLAGVNIALRDTKDSSLRALQPATASDSPATFHSYEEQRSSEKCGVILFGYDEEGRFREIFRESEC